MKNLSSLCQSPRSRLVVVLALGLTAAIPPSRGEAGSQVSLYGMNDFNTPGVRDQLIRIDFATGAAVPLHTFSSGLTMLESLTYDPFLDVLWTTNNGFVLRVDPLTYAETPVGPSGYTDIDGVAVQPGTGVLFGITFGGNDLITIDKNTGVATVINGHVEEGHRLEDLAFDSAGHLFILTTEALVQVNPANGNVISEAVLSNNNSVESLVWWPDGNTFLSGADRDNFKDLVTIDKNTGQVAFVSLTIHSGVHDFDALALVPTPQVGVQDQSWSVIKGLYR